MHDPRADLFLTLWAKHAPLPFAWPHTERFDCWFSMAIPGVFARLKTLEQENQRCTADLHQLQRERDRLQAEVEQLRARAYPRLSAEEEPAPADPPVSPPPPTTKD